MAMEFCRAFGPAFADVGLRPAFTDVGLRLVPVSYTHLTLPTMPDV